MNPQSNNDPVPEEITNALAKDKESGQYDVALVQYHVHNGSDTARVNYNDLDNKTRFIVLSHIVKNSASVSVDTTVGGDFVMPFSGYIVSDEEATVGATVDTAGITGTTTVDINKNGTTILRTKITIDSTETSSRTAATPALLVNSTETLNFVTGDIFTVDVDAVSTTAPKGLSVFINVVQTI